jgi:hypothetical protein
MSLPLHFQLVPALRLRHTTQDSTYGCSLSSGVLSSLRSLPKWGCKFTSTAWGFLQIRYTALGALQAQTIFPPTAV